MINKIGISPAFTRNVHVTCYESIKPEQREKVNSPEFVEDLDKTEKLIGESNDTVKIRLNPFEPYNSYINVITDCPGGKRALTNVLDKHVSEKYAEMKAKLKNGEGTFMPDADVLKYVI